MSRARERLEKHERGGALAPDAACYDRGAQTSGENPHTSGGKVGARIGRGAHERQHRCRERWQGRGRCRERRRGHGSVGDRHRDGKPWLLEASTCRWTGRGIDDELMNAGGGFTGRCSVSGPAGFCSESRSLVSLVDIHTGSKF